MSYGIDPLKEHWDVVVIGSGIGGATAGYALARAGKRVLFCERGRSLLDASTLRGEYAEHWFPGPEAPQSKHAAILARAGRCSDEWLEEGSSRHLPFIPFIGSGTGGSSGLYGMGMERFFPSDFEPSGEPRTSTTLLRPPWPIKYQELAPYYAAAESLYQVRGHRDPLRPQEPNGYVAQPPPLSSAAGELFEFFERKGLHPYRLPVACKVVEGCTGCQGFLCARNCKTDSLQACLKPAIHHHGAMLLEDCHVESLAADGSRITGAICKWRGEKVMLQADVFVLAAGALETPRILLRSSSRQWPLGLANQSGLVGKNLMRHFIDLWLVFPKSRPSAADFTKEIAFSDLYEAGGHKLGSVQSFGRLPPARALVAEMIEDARRGPIPRLAAILKPARRILQPVLDSAFSRGVLLASMVEDFPSVDNRVMPDTAGSGPRPSISYRVLPSEQQRIRLMRKKMKHLLAPYRHLLIKQAENSQRLAHACGTCRFGVDPQSSVLDRDNRAHGVANLFIVDGSFFPSSAGTNPALTIAANALRAGERMLSAGHW